ncbi:DNA-3-methyladenine glycosylase [Pedobacter sp. PACM 27299]|uniref:DNA-3-methyladenine glycosylase I n=1 Tax=Pedobacter sp. PACM 27299 TaxID=1727164 RepID=UPI00070626EE|nr:DNA-3-methyladenine glycosylase I [Pedobacter sp. PACM 27299]ALL04170.1 DNA-3-methyladenine glycosylase [Pedobacter sp. PACM 27299]
MSEIIRCGWCGTDPLYVKYHDEEWGKPVYDDQTLFEFLILEGAQAGLSWITILKRRAGYKAAFADFDVQKVAAFTEVDEERLMNDPGIIRNRLKVKAAINNARLFIEIQKEFGSFSDFIWGFIPGKKPIVNVVKSLSEVPARTEISDAISKDMKKRGFKFFGTTICYAHMQATGMVNDHVTGCISK